jgi:hypothetical protein
MSYTLNIYIILLKVKTRAGGMIQVIRHLHSKYKALSSNPSIAKKNIKLLEEKIV